MALRKNLCFYCLLLLVVKVSHAQDLRGPGGEKFSSRILCRNLSDPWEILYGPDNFLWATESRGYTVSRINTITGERKVVLDLSEQREFPRYDKIPDEQDGGKPWPQGGLMGMSLHPQFLKGKPYVYLTYIYHYEGARDTGEGGRPNWGGHHFKARLVRYRYNSAEQKLDHPITLCDTIPASNDHNGGRLLVAPVKGNCYLFYSIGDMGAGQFENGGQPNQAQNIQKYEGKILRFNTEPDEDKNEYDRWIPNDNPFNSSSQNAVWSYGHRNPQGLSYARIKGTDFLFSAEHGPFGDDEINIIEKGKNYGHPLIEGYNDDNYNGFAAAASDRKTLPGIWHTTYPLITSERENAQKIGPANYRDPIKSFYPAANSYLRQLLTTIRDSPRSKADWPALAPSSIAVYTNAAIPGWNHSLLISSLKEGKLVRLKLSAAGDQLIGDTLNYFKAKVRYRDMAISPDGKKIYLATDSSTVTSGPSGEDPEGSKLRGVIIELAYKGSVQAAESNKEKAWLRRNRH